MGHIHSVHDSDARFSINPATRAIRNDTFKKNALMQYDHNSERFTFECPRHIEGHDLSTCNLVEVHYLNVGSAREQKSGLYEVDDLKVNPDNAETVICTWLVSRNATGLAGSLSFLLRFCCVENGVIQYAWHTDTYSEIRVSAGIDASGMFETEYLEIIERWKASVMQHFTEDLTAWKQGATDDLLQWKQNTTGELTQWKTETKEEITQAASDEITSKTNAFGAKWSAELEAERKRIDSFVALEDGSTTGDAELQDIRIGADGKTYDSAGTAIRTQMQTKVSNLISNEKIINGAYIDANGSVKTHAAYAYVESAVIPGTVVAYSFTDDNETVRLALYDIDGNFIESYPCTTATQYIVIPENACTLKATYNSRSSLMLVNDATDILRAIDKLKRTNAELEKASLTNYLQSTVIEGAYIRASDGNISTHSVYAYAEMPAIPCATIKYRYSSNQSIAGLAFYDENDAYICGVVASVETQELTVPENAVKIRATANKSYKNVVIVNNVEEIARGISILTKKIAVLSETVNEAMAKPSIHLPSKSVAVVGHEWNMYFDNIILCDNISNYDIRCSISPSLSSWSIYGEWLRINPTAAGTHTVTVSVYNKHTNKPITSKSFTLHVIEDAAISDKKVIFIGDSLTDTCYYPAEIQHNLSGGGIVSLGTRTETVNIGGESLIVSHEGRAGWSARDYFTAEAHNMPNAFYNPDTGTFDFAYYMQNQGYSGADIVSIFLGTNGVGYDDNVDNLKAMIDSIHEYDANIIVLISLINMPATQDGYGYRGFTSTAYSFKYNVTKLNDSYIDNFDGVIENVDVSEVYFALDTKRDYGSISVPASARNPVQITMQTNNVHPNSLGYLKFADVIYNNLLYHLTK